MKTDDVRGLSDSELVLFIEAAQAEKQARDEKRRQETIARIKELAGAEGLSVHIDGLRGRPPKLKTEVKHPANDNHFAAPEKGVKNGRI